MKRLMIVAILTIIWSHVAFKCVDHFQNLMAQRITRIELIK
jgi:hypothetical protein